MTTTGKIVVAALGTALFLTACGKKPGTSAPSWSLNKAAASAQLKQFVAAQEAQARALAKQEGKDLPPVFDSFYQAAGKGDWQEALNLFDQLSQRVRTDSNLRGCWWGATLDAYGVFEMFPPGDKYATAFGNDIIKSIPDGSIYFGGTDPGRFVVTALSESHAEGKPFFTLTQNALADGTYLDYLRSMYGGKIHIPTADELQKCFQDYKDDARRRLQNHQLKPGENIKMKDGDVQISRQTAVMAINSLLAKVIFDQNPNCECYIEVSFPLDWMYPYLEPHGLIFKINRQPLPEWSDEIVRRDHDYWSKYVTPMIGGWLKDGTTVKEVAAFSKKVVLRRNFWGFKGDPLFIQSASSREMFSYLRSNIADVYVWRMNHATTADKKDRMAREADFAYRQALALCPYMSGTVTSYVDLLKSQNRIADAILVADAAGQFPASRNSNPGACHRLVGQLKRLQGVN